jgi:CRP/FNR family cyclic AMP-dependent transcriptional regulator
MTVSSGVILFAEGESPQHVFVLCAGRMKLSAASRDGKILLVKIAKPGDVLGLSAALADIPYELTAQAIEHSQVKAFQSKDFLHFIQDCPEGCQRAVESLNNEYRRVLTDACRIALSGSISDRVAHLLLELAIEGQDTTNAQPEFYLALTHETIAAMLGSSRETITRVLNTFQRRGLISIKGTRVTILRKHALELML